MGRLISEKCATGQAECEQRFRQLKANEEELSQKASTGGYMKKAVIFDMDGVLIDSEPVYLAHLRHFLEENHCRVDEELLQAMAGASSKKTWGLMAQMWHKETSPESIQARYREAYPDFQAPYSKVLFPGVRELLAWLGEVQITAAIASSSSERSIRRMLMETELEAYFSCLVSGEMFKESKPDPEIYLYTLGQLGLPAEECIVVEDSTYGISAAKAAGLEVVARRDTRFPFDQSEADYLVERTCQLKEVLTGAWLPSHLV